MIPVRAMLLGLLWVGTTGCKEQRPYVYVAPDPCLWFNEPENPIEINVEEFEQVNIDALDDTWPRPVCIRCNQTTKGREFYGVLEKLCLARVHFNIRLLSGDTIHYGYPVTDGHATHPWYAPDWKPYRIEIKVYPQSYTSHGKTIELDALAKELGPLKLHEKRSLKIYLHPDTNYEKIDALLQLLHDQEIKYFSFSRKDVAGTAFQPADHTRTFCSASDNLK